MSNGTIPPRTAPNAMSWGMARVHSAISDVTATEVHQVSGRDLAEVDRAIARLEALKLKMVAAADRQGAAAASGMPGTSAWLAAHTRSWGAKAASDVSLATALETSLPVTREALAAGSLSTAHATVIAGTTSRLPACLTDEERARVESALVAQAKLVDPARLRRSARRALLAAERSAEEARAHEDAELRGEEHRARSRVRLTMHDNLDGTVTGHFTVPTLAGAILRKTIQQMVSPRRHRAPGSPEVPEEQRALGQSALHGQRGAPGPHGVAAGHGLPGRQAGHGAWSQQSRAGSESTGHGGGPGTAAAAPSVPGLRAGREHWGGQRDWAHESGKAFVELLEHLPTEHLAGKVAATVVVTLDEERLREAVGAAHLDTGHDLSAAEVRRLACSAGILPVVLNGASLPLDLGRTQRFFTEAQRVALATLYDECAADGCDRPFAWSELHHEDPWARGGATNLDLAVPLCGSDHQRAHDPRYEHRVHTDRKGRKRVTFTRRT